MTNNRDRHRRSNGPRPISNGVTIGSIGIIGYGNFGAWAHLMTRRFSPRTAVKVYAPEKKPDGKTFFSIKDVAKADAVVLAVPISAYESVIKKILPLMRKEGVIVDVATVKTHTVNILKKLAKKTTYIATHPMFGPESYEKRNGNIKGFRIVIADHTLPTPAYRKLRAFLVRCGFDVVEMTPRAHDRQLAETLFLTHFIGQVVEKAGFRRTDIDTVSFGYLMDAVESVRADTKLFRDVFRFNPYCLQVLKRFGYSERTVFRLLAKRSR